jgi:hypothetical protein
VPVHEAPTPRANASATPRATASPANSVGLRPFGSAAILDSLMHPPANVVPFGAPPLKPGLEAAPPPFADELLPATPRDLWSLHRLGLTLTSDGHALVFSSGARVPHGSNSKLDVAILPDRTVLPRPLVWVHERTPCTNAINVSRHEAFSLYSALGTRLWSYEADVAPQYTVNAFLRLADLTGDGVFEALLFAPITKGKGQGVLRGQAFTVKADRLVLTRADLAMGMGSDSPWPSPNSADPDSRLAKVIVSAVPGRSDIVDSVLTMGEAENAYAGDDTVNIVSGDGDDSGMPLTLVVVGGASTAHPKVLATLPFGVDVRTPGPAKCSDMDRARNNRVTTFDAEEDGTVRGFVVEWRSSPTVVSSQAFSYDPRARALVPLAPPTIVATCDDYGFRLIVAGGMVHKVPLPPRLAMCSR